MAKFSTFSSCFNNNLRAFSEYKVGHIMCIMVEESSMVHVLHPLASLTYCRSSCSNFSHGFVYESQQPVHSALQCTQLNSISFYTC